LYQVIESGAQHCGLIAFYEDPFHVALHEDQAGMEGATLIQPREVPNVVGHEDHAVSDRIACDVFVTNGPQIDLVDMNGMEASATCKYHKAGAQILVDQELEVAGLKTGLLFKP